MCPWNIPGARRGGRLRARQFLLVSVGAPGTRLRLSLRARIFEERNIVVGAVPIALCWLCWLCAGFCVNAVGLRVFMLTVAGERARTHGDTGEADDDIERVLVVACKIVDWLSLPLWQLSLPDQG